MVMVMVNIALQLLPKFKFQRGPLFRETVSTAYYYCHHRHHHHHHPSFMSDDSQGLYSIPLTGLILCHILGFTLIIRETYS